MIAGIAPVPQLICDDLFQPPARPSPLAYLDCFRFLFRRRDQAASFAACARWTAT